MLLEDALVLPVYAMNEINVSIIVPVYNVENYIERCLESIVTQTHRGLEAIFVDDCGQDDSIGIVERFMADYDGDIELCIVHHDENRGLSASRNTGIMAARGKYVYFLDSDDSISTDCISLLYSKIEEDTTVQMVVGNYKIIGGLYFEPMNLPQRSYVSEEIIKYQFTYNLYTMAWNKLVNKEFIIDNGLFFQEGIIHEDNLWSFCMACSLNKIAVVLKPTYNYLIRSGSIITENDLNFHEDKLFEVMRNFVSFLFSDRTSVRVKSNITIYKYLQDELRRFVMRPYREGNMELAYERYTDFRGWKVYPLGYIFFNRKINIGQKLASLHRLFPIDNGFRLYCWLNRNKYKKANDISRMKVTIITISYNNLEGLKRTVPSVLSQTYTGYEYIVIDGGSTDGSKEYLQSQERIDYWVSEPDTGVYNAMNKGLEHAHCEYCIFMNSGDHFFSASSLEEAVPLLQGADFYTGGTVCIDGNDVYPWLPPSEITMELMLNGALSHQATFSKTEVLKRHRFNENNRIVSDWELVFDEWYYNKCTYESIDPMIASFYMDGISNTDKDLDKEERKRVIDRIINGKKVKYEQWNGDEKKRQKQVQRREKLRKKIEIAMKKKPIARDWKIIRNGFKFLIKDIFN